jgi:hypothetical protein
MAGLVLNRSPSVGAVGIANEFAEAEVIDEEKALELARQTLRRDS